jgi:phosphatidyl-myo-inositol dimannoside synthase
MKRRILLILTEFPPSIGGMQTHAILLSRHLHDSGSEVTIFTYRASGNKAETEECDNAFPFPINRELSRVGYFHNLNTLVKAIKSFKPDLIYSSTVFYGILEKMTGIPTICRSVGNDIMRPWIAYPFQIGTWAASNAYMEKRLHNFFKRIDKPELVEILFREQRLLLTVNAAKASSKILANSTFTKNLLMDAGVSKRNIQIVTGGVDAAFFNQPNFINKSQLRQELGLPPDRKILMTACRLVDKKGVDFLITALAASNPAKSNWHLVIVGKGRRMARLRKLAYSMGVDEYVTFIGSIPYEGMPPYYWASDIFVLASTVFKDPVTGLKDAETMGRVLCEANAAGVPIVATRSGGIPSVITHGDNGLLFPENDVPIFHEHINRLLDDLPYRRELIRNGIKKARDSFDWEHILKAHEKVFAVKRPSASAVQAAAAPKP